MFKTANQGLLYLCLEHFNNNQVVTYFVVQPNLTKYSNVIG